MLWWVCLCMPYRHCQFNSPPKCNPHNHQMPKFPNHSYPSLPLIKGAIWSTFIWDWYGCREWHFLHGACSTTIWSARDEGSLLCCSEDTCSTLKIAKGTEFVTRNYLLQSKPKWLEEHLMKKVKVEPALWSKFVNWGARPSHLKTCLLSLLLSTRFWYEPG